MIAFGNLENDYAYFCCDMIVDDYMRYDGVYSDNLLRATRKDSCGSGGLFLNMFRGGFNLLGVYGIMPNSLRVNPAFRKSTSWGVYRGGMSNNMGYNLQIRVRQWMAIRPGNRWFGFRWWYGIN